MSSIREVIDAWGFQLVADFKTEIRKAVGTHGAGQETALEGSVIHKTMKTIEGYTFTLSMNDYWKYVESGRKKGAKGVPQSVLGKQWQNKKRLWTK